VLPTRGSSAGVANACFNCAGNAVAIADPDGLQPDAHGLQPNAHGLQPNADCFHQFHHTKFGQLRSVFARRVWFLMVGSDGTSIASGTAKEPGLSTAVDFITRVVAPASFLTAILYYFGYVREHALFGYFGVDLESLQFSTTDYLVRSAGTVFLPVGTVLVFGVLALLAHHLLTFALGNANRRLCRAAWVGIAIIAVTLLTLGVVGLEQPKEANLSPLLPPIALGVGAFLVEYTVCIAAEHTPLSQQLMSTLKATQTARRILIGALLLVSAFWATTVVAEQRGDAVARALEASLPVQPGAVVYSRQRLQIAGIGITVTHLSGADAAFTYRYNGLRPLIHSGGHWFLLPAGWAHNNGSTVIILADTAPGIRVDLGP
jgi:hypothetical protein